MAAGRITRSLTAHGGDVDLDRDRALVQRCQGGDGAAFAELYTQYHDRLHRFCVRRLLNKDEADEVTQEAFLRAWRALPTFAGDLRFYPWLTVIAKNLCTDALRRQARYGTVANFDRVGPDATRPDAFSTAISSEETVMASYDGELAAQALTRLSERHRKVLALREEAGLSYQEIARAEGVEISTVETL
ncbi:MAG: RNA polymerase sigma factor, partial [Acidimicrobiales bacterium]